MVKICVCVRKYLSPGLWQRSFLKPFMRFLMFVCPDKYRISRDDVDVGQILGEGFFGEVHDGVYKSPVNMKIKCSGHFSCNVMKIYH